MSHDARVIVVGGGIVGCAVLYGLARNGWTDALLLERLELTAGSTWHAAGNVTHFGHDVRMTRLYADSIRTYLEAEAESGHAVGFHRTGSLRLATTGEEMAAYRRLEPAYAELRIPYRTVAPEALAEIHPLLNVEGIHGAAHTPGDGHVDPSGATHAMAKCARARGARIERRCPVQGLHALPSGGWEVETVRGPLRAEQIVLAASFWTRELAEAIGLQLPLYPVQHHEVVTGPVPEIETLGFELPTVRDPYAPSNTRQEGAGFICGVYESEPEFWALDGIPPDFGQELLVPDIERLEPHLMRVIERLPAFGEAGIKTVNNGPICYTPDGFPLLGPLRRHPGLWLASGFPVGIGTGGGSGQFLADWMARGRPPYDLPIVDPARFDGGLDRESCLARIRKTYAEGYVLPRG
jgi:dimethylglycine dehydrogenase